MAASMTRDTALADLCRRYRVQRLELFGSAARGEFDPERSDLDFIVSFVPMESGLADAYLGLLTALEDHFGRRVDVMTSKVIRNPYLKFSVDRDRKLIFEA